MQTGLKLVKNHDKENRVNLNDLNHKIGKCASEKLSFNIGQINSV